MLLWINRTTFKSDIQTDKRIQNREIVSFYLHVWWRKCEEFSKIPETHEDTREATTKLKVRLIDTSTSCIKFEIELQFY